MKTEATRLGLTLIAFVAAAAVPSARQTAPAATLSLRGTVLEVRTDRPSYALGELVTLDISARNRSTSPIVLPDSVDVWVGHVAVMIGFEDGPFREYRGPGWGLHDVGSVETITLRPRQSVSTEATILYNHGMASRHLNSDAAARITARYMDEGYGLPIPGRYRIKAVLHGFGFQESIESAAVEIAVQEPVGTDRDVWSALATDPELGYFIQAGTPRARLSSARRRRLIEVMEKLVTSFPESRHAERMRDSLSRYHESVDELIARGLIVR